MSYNHTTKKGEALFPAASPNPNLRLSLGLSVWLLEQTTKNEQETDDK